MASARKKRKFVWARQPMTKLDDTEAQKVAVAWYGEHAEAFPPDGLHLDSYAVGWWDHAIPDNHEDLDAWPNLHVEGIGSTWGAAFRDADPRKWAAYCIRRRAMSKGATHG
jgi:hypothetical protein